MFMDACVDRSLLSTEIMAQQLDDFHLIMVPRRELLLLNSSHIIWPGSIVDVGSVSQPDPDRHRHGVKVFCGRT